jgi:hypothetical protein
MEDAARTFAVASDNALVQLITAARNRLVIVAPALTKPVAEALSGRLADLGQLDITVILDADPEVYRLGFGDQEALETIRIASANQLFELREQPGVRIGVVISDGTTMVYSPVSKNVEAGSTSAEKPNAIVLTGSATDRIASAAGADNSETAPNADIGEMALKPARVKTMQENLKANPPKPFDITRKLNVFSSKVQYVELSVSNYQLTKHQITLPEEFSNFVDEDLKQRVTSRIRAPLDGVGLVEIKIELDDGKIEILKIDDEWLKKERKRIEDAYTFQINNFGRAILSSDRAAFDEQMTRFESVIEKYQTALQSKLSDSKAKFGERIIAEFGPKWAAKPPAYFARWKIEPIEDNITSELRRWADDIFERAITFDKPKVKVLYKNVAPENIGDPKFVDVLKKHMIRKRVPKTIIDSLFESGQAAPESGAFMGRQPA